MATILAALAFAACGTKTTTNDIADAYNDTQADVPADAVQDVAGDHGSDVAGDTNGSDVVDVNKCIEKIKDNEIFQLFPNDNPTQIHPSAAFDGEAIWFAWSAVVESTGLFEIRAARMACDGTLLVTPFSVDSINPGNSFEAEIALSGGNMLIAWHVDDSMYDPAGSNARVNATYTTDVIDDTSTDTNVPADIIEDTAVPADVPVDTVIPADTIADAPTDTAIVDVVQPPNDNMLVRYRTFKIDGTPIMAEALRYLPELDGEEPLVNNWLPKVTGLPDGRFAMSSAWAWPGGKVFQTVIQRFNADGTKSGNLIHPYPAPNMEEMYPDISADGAGNLHLVWVEEGWLVTEQNSIWAQISSATIMADSEVPLEESPVVIFSGEYPSIKATSDGNVFTVFGGLGEDIKVYAETAGRTVVATTNLDYNSVDEYSPEVAVGPNGPAVVWYRSRDDGGGANAFNNDVMIKTLAWNGGNSITTFGDPIVVNTINGLVKHSAISVYEPIIVSLGQGNYLVSWTERDYQVIDGTGKTMYKVFGRFMKL